MKKIYKVEGMHCHSCEVLLEKKIAQIKGVFTVNASLKKGLVEVKSENDLSSKIKAIITNNGYVIHDDAKNKNKRFRELLLASLFAFLLIIILSFLSSEQFLDFSNFSTSNMTLFFLVGIAAGFSTCMAIVGGLVLGLSARHVEKHPEATPLQNFRPHLFFNLGRVSSFLIFGGILAYLGSFVFISPRATGFIGLIVSIIMIYLGLILLSFRINFFSRFSFFKKITSFISDDDSSEYSHAKSFLLGGLTFFLPCGFTQAVQLFALTTGSIAAGSLVMFYFALGTTPGLLAIGGLSAIPKSKKVMGIFSKTVGIIIIILALQNINNAKNLLYLNSNLDFLKNSTNLEEIGKDYIFPNLINGVQVLEATYDPDESSWQYVINPKNFVLEVNKPARLEVFSKRDGFGCMGSLAIPGLSREFKVFEAEKISVISFLPQKTGDFPITCAMGVPMGNIRVVE